MVVVGAPLSVYIRARQGGVGHGGMEHGPLQDSMDRRARPPSPRNAQLSSGLVTVDGTVKFRYNDVHHHTNMHR